MSNKEHKKKGRTLDLDHAHYSYDLIRKYEDPEFAKAASRYEQHAKRQKAKQEWYAQEEQEVGRARREKASRKKKYRFRPFRLIRNIIILVLILAIAVGGAAYALFSRMTQALDPMELNEYQLAIDSGVAKDLEDYVNIAILGSDARSYEPIEGSRTDAMIIMSINKNTHEVRLISVLRDSYLKLGYIDGSLYLDKATHAFHYGGAEDTLAMLNRNLDLNITDYVLFDWKAVADAVDSLGGIELDIQENEISDMNSYMSDTAETTGGTYTEITQAGVQTLNGTEAVTYCRIRKTSGGDEGRGNRTKIVIEALLKKGLKNPLDLIDMMDTVLPQIQTNITKSKILSLLPYGRNLEFGDSLTWPQDYYGGLARGMWVAIPTTLESNVTWLHREAFGQSNYTPTETCQEISTEISQITGFWIPQHYDN